MSTAVLKPRVLPAKGRGPEQKRRQVRVERLRDLNATSRVYAPSKRSRAALRGMGQRLRARRIELGLTVRTLAGMAGIHHYKIVGAENETSYGGLNVPTFKLICVALNVSADWLLGLTDDPTPRG